MTDKTKIGFTDKQSIEFRIARASTINDAQIGILLMCFCAAMASIGVVLSGVMGWYCLVLSALYGVPGYKLLRRYLQKMRTFYGLQPNL